MPILGIILLGTGLRVYRIGYQSLWLDEFFSYFLALRNFSGIIEGTAQDVLPPLYYLLLHGALKLGTNEVILRSVSMMFSVLTLPVMYILAKSLFTRRVALLATLLLAIGPLQILFAQEARMYTMFTFFVGLGLYFFWRAWEKGKSVDWLFFALAVTAALYTHSLALFYLLAIDGFCLLNRSKLRKRWPGLLAAHVTSFLLFLPWLVIMIRQLPRLQSEFEGAGQSILALITTPYLFIFGISLQPQLVPVALFVGLAIVAFSFLAIWYAWRQNLDETSGLILTLCIFLIPVIGIFVMSYIQPVFVLRRLLPASLGLTLILAWTILEAKPKWLNTLTGALTGVLMIFSLVNYYYDSDVQKEPFRDFVETVKSTTESSDVFVHASDTSAFAFAYYAPDLDSHFLAGDPDYVMETNRGRAQRIAGLEPKSLEEIITDQERFWLVVVMDHNLEYQRQLVEEFDGKFVRLRHDNIHGVDVIRYGFETGS